MSARETPISALAIREYVLVVANFEMERMPQSKVVDIRVRAYDLTDAHALFAVIYPGAKNGVHIVKGGSYGLAARNELLRIEPFERENERHRDLTLWEIRST